MKNGFVWSCAALVLLVLLTGCEWNPARSPDSTTSGRPAITGRLVRSDGITPASGAIVSLQPRDAILAIEGPAKKAASAEKIVVQAAQDGSFSIDSLAAGVYSLEGADADGNAVRLDSVPVDDPAVTTDISSQSLLPTGSIHGVVSLDNGGDPSNVFILVFGSDRFIQVNSDGTFLMDDLPYGSYTLKYVCVAKECGTSRTVPVTVLPGTTVEVDTVTLYSGVCAPRNLSLQYDSIKMMVTLQWDPCDDDAGIMGYGIYRYNNETADQYPINRLNPVLVTDSCLYTDFNILPNGTYTYGVASVSANGITSRKAGPESVTAVSAGFTYDTISYNEGTLVAGMHWDGEDRLQVATTETIAGDSNRSTLYVDYYDSDLSFNQRILIADSLEMTNKCLIRDDYVVFRMKYTDGSICYTSYSTSGEKRYAFTLSPLDLEIWAWEENNDTLFISARLDNGNWVLKAFDTTGTILFSIDDYEDELYRASDGSLYTYSLRYEIINQFFPSTQSVTEVFRIQRDPDAHPLWYFGAGNGIFVLCNNIELWIFNTDGVLQSRCMPGEASNISVDSRGRIAFCDYHADMVCIITPK